MPRSIIAKYAAEDLFDVQNAAVAFADENQKINWFNNSFKRIVGSGRIKGISFANLFDIPSPGLENILSKKKPLIRNLPSFKSNLVITSLYSKDKKKKLCGYMLELTSENLFDTRVANGTEQSNDNSSFQNHLQDILVLLVKENSLDVLIEEILKRGRAITNSDFGIIVLNKNGSKFEFVFSDPKGHIVNVGEIEKTINSDFSFIQKWLELNNKSLVAFNRSDNIGFNLAKALLSESLIISPSFFDNKLLASIIVGKKDADYSAIDINQLEQFAALLSFAISNVHTRELNATLEGRLLQTQKLETIGKLSSGMAHDFSNLLSSIFGSVNLLRKRVPKSEPVDKLINNIEDCSVRARDLTKGLLSYGKPTPKRKELVKPNTLLNEISKVITQTFPRTIIFVDKVDDNLHDILGNSTEIYQILLNLCVNAKEATNETGTITLSAKNITINENNRVNYPLLDEGNYIQFSVDDDGAGIEEDDLQKIFDPYFSTKTKDSGTGLGLYVTYGIIKAHNGIIDVSSKPGRGTTFDVFIPAFEPRKVKKKIPSDKIILLADDEPMLNELLTELLESNGYNVISVSSGTEVLKLLTEEIKVNLAIIDYNMPEMNGLDTIQKVRQLNLDFPIILSSGSMKVDDDIDLGKYKINSRLQKPYEFETMLSTIQELI